MTTHAHASSSAFPTIAGYLLVEQLYQGIRTSVYRAIQTSCQQSVILKLLHEYPSFGELLQFRNQYTIAKDLPIEGIVQPLSLESLGNRYMLVMEDWGGISLSNYLAQLGEPHTLDLSACLKIAIQLAQILHDLSQHRVIHKDIKPANILIHPESKQIKLIDFSIASLLPRETQEIQDPNALEGTLTYLAPEQTGRMNRGIDYRADYYALGVTLYYLLSGKLPFESSDPLELVHCHLAKVPTPLHQVQDSIPKPVSAIVAKLMAKNAEDRYQSALGLKSDLERCLTQWQETGSIADFPLGLQDLSDRFLIPEKLYGREAEVQTLLEAFERVSGGSSELMLVAGFSGIGKTAVVNEVHKPIVRQRGYFIKGKYDQFNRNVPLFAFVQALRDLIGQVLSQSDEQLQGWKTRILEAVGEHGQVLIEVIPELEQIIGKQPPAPELSGSAVQNRFNLLFQKFISVFAATTHPLVIFLDDLQWADIASLQLIKLLINDNNNLLMLGAYRDNEVTAAHPLMWTVRDLKQAGATINTITLTPLKFENTNQLVADTLNCSLERARLLTELVERKTQGNPFFTTQFLKALHEEKHITFNRDLRFWQCDIAQVRALSLTTDVVEFMAQQLQKLPLETQRILKLAACVGNQFDLTTLAIVSEQSPTSTAAGLWKALQEGLIVPTAQVYKFFRSEGIKPLEEQNHVNPIYRFLHDRVQQAAYSLIASEQREATHLTIGQLLLQSIPETELEAKIFEVVSHLNRATSLIQTESEKAQLIQLNLLAGHKAKAAAAHASALNYFDLGIRLLAANSWQTNYAQTLALYENAAESAYGCGELEQMEHYIDAVLDVSKNPLDCVKVYEIRIQAYTAQGRFTEAITTGISILSRLGLDLPMEPTEAEIQQSFQTVSMLLDGKSTDDLFNLPTTDAAEPLAILKILSVIMPSCYLSGSALFPVVNLEQVRITIQQGNSMLAALVYSSYIPLLNSVQNDLEAAHQFGQLALKLQAKFGAKFLQGKVNTVVGMFAIPYKFHLRETLPLHLEGFQAALETGDLEFAGYNAEYICQCAYLLNQSLEEAEQENKTYSALLRKLGQATTANYIQIHLQAIETLRGQRSPLELDTQAQQLETFFTTSNDLTGFCFYRTHQLVVAYLLKDSVRAKYNAECARQYLKAGAGQIIEQIFYFYDSLTALSFYPEAVDPVGVLQQVEQNQTVLQLRAKHAPMNFQHKYDLVEAERHRVLGQISEAINLYDCAIAGARENGYLQEEALANELAAEFYLAWGKERIAQDYLVNAYYSYALWGAKAKVENLEHRYPNLLAPILQQQVPLSISDTVFAINWQTSNRSLAMQAYTAGSSSVSLNLDLSTVLKASQTLLGEIQLDRLLATLLHIALESAGAGRGILLLPHEAQWFVRAVATLDQPAQIQSVPFSRVREIPHSLIHTVKRTLEPVVIDEVSTHPPLLKEMDGMLSQPKSLLCTPILQQGKLVAILYLENHVTVGAFTRDRIKLLNLLCSQAAIALENANLYQQAQSYAQELEQSLQALQSSQVALQESEFANRALTTQLQNLTNNLPGVVYQFKIDPQGQGSFSYISNRSQDLFEVEASVAQQHADAINRQIDPLDLDAFQIAMTRSIQQLQPFTWVGRCNLPSGKQKWIEVRSLPQRQADGSTIWDGVMLDVSERKAAEILAQQKTQELAQALQDLQMTQLQMVQSEKMASLGNLVAGVAHEINNPIGFLSGSINNAKDYVSDLLSHLTLYEQQYPSPVAALQEHREEIDLEFLREDLPKLLDSMKGATHRIKGISTSLRTFSRADTEYKVKANLLEGLESTLLILKYRLKANEHRPAIEVIQNYGEIAEIECFPGQLNQVFMNILANAIDMFDEMAQSCSFEDLDAQPQKITLCSEQVADEVCIRIRDNGKGMTQDVQARIFDHLFTTKGVGKGTGLGLAIARQIVVEKHGGSLEVQSEVGVGSEFIIRLPAGCI